MKEMTVYETTLYGIPYYIAVIDNNVIAQFGADDAKQDTGIHLLETGFAYGGIRVKTRYIDMSHKEPDDIYELLRRANDD